MKAYLIDAGARTIAPVDYEYHTIRQWLPGGIAVAATFSNGDVLYVDDEALLHPAKVAFRFKRRPDGQPMMSNGLVTGSDTADDTLPPASTIAQIQAEIEWMDLSDAMAWFRSKEAEAAVVRISGDGERKVLHTWGDFVSMMTGGQEG